MAVTKVRDLMTRQVETLLVGETLDLAKGVMNIERIRHLPVVDRNEQLVGLITQSDILSAWVSRSDPTSETFDQVAAEIPVEMIMIKDVASVGPDTRASEAGRILLDRKFGCLPVVENGKLVGIVTDTDFVRFACEHFAKES